MIMLGAEFQAGRSLYTVREDSLADFMLLEGSTVWGLLRALMKNSLRAT